jgi:PAS domain S-box-containing protein
MIAQRLPYFLVYAVALLFSSIVAYYAWKNRKGAGNTAFAISIFLEISWLIGYFFEVSSSTLQGKIFWDNFQYIGAVFAPVALVIFALEFTGRKINATRIAIVLSIFPALALIPILTNIWPDLIRTQAKINVGLPFDELTYGFGIVTNLANDYLYLISLAYIGILISGFFRKKGVFRPQLFIVTVGTLIPILGSIFGIAYGIKFGNQRDISPLTFAISNVVVAWGIFRYRLFNIIPIARETLFENFEDVLIILDKEDHIIDVNPAGQLLLGSRDNLINSPIQSLLPELYSQFHDVQKTRTEIATADNIYFDLQITPLHDRTGELSGRLISAHNITQQKKTEQELQITNEKNSRRAAQLQAITELSEAISQLQDLGKLFTTATDLISARFGFYHVGIFLIDNEREFAIMQATNSEGGQKMLARGHRLKMGTGVVGFAAQTGQPRIALDVGADAVFFDNPDLPTTRSEAALPMKTRGETIGVLDVQSTESGAFSNEDLQVLTALANQVSIALENTRLLTETRAALAQVQEVYDEFTRAEWSRAAAKAEQAGFRYQTGRIEMLEESLNAPEIVSAVKTGEVVMNQTNGSKEKRSTVAVPVKLRGEVIGVLHIESDDPTKTWQSDEVSLVQAVAERAAFAMENARLFQDARRRASKERLISEATSKISGALSVENILQTTAQELERVLGGSEVLIRFRSKEQA